MDLDEPEEIVTGTCTDMCPADERRKRDNENDVHKIELLVAFPGEKIPVKGENDYEYAQFLQRHMIKKFQRSSADHALQIADALRTPEALLKTIDYMETYLMPLLEESARAEWDALGLSKLTVYMYLWDRCRMIAKDFTLQQSSLEPNDVWVDCHERMARLFVLMDHHMKSEEEYLGGHEQQNGEQLNNLLKTLDSLYNKAHLYNLSTKNRPEFTAYFLIFQIGNGGEVAKHIQKLSDDLLESEEIKYALRVWAALANNNVVQFMKLFDEGNLLQCCLLERYIDKIRFYTLKKYMRVYVAGKPCAYPLDKFVHDLRFVNREEAVKFLVYCHVKLKIHHRGELVDFEYDEENFDHEADYSILLENQNIENNLPLNNKNVPIPPSTGYNYTMMYEKHCRHNLELRPLGEAAFDSLCYHEDASCQFTIKEICCGLASPSTYQGSSAPQIKKKKVKAPVAFSTPPPISRAISKPSPVVASVPVPFTPPVVPSAPSAASLEATKIVKAPKKPSYDPALLNRPLSSKRSDPMEPSETEPVEPVAVPESKEEKASTKASLKENILKKKALKEKKKTEMEATAASQATPVMAFSTPAKSIPTADPAFMTPVASASSAPAQRAVPANNPFAGFGKKNAQTVPTVPVETPEPTVTAAPAPAPTPSAPVTGFSFPSTDAPALPKSSGATENPFATPISSFAPPSAAVADLFGQTQTASFSTNQGFSTQTSFIPPPLAPVTAPMQSQIPSFVQPAYGIAPPVSSFPSVPQAVPPVSSFMSPMDMKISPHAHSTMKVESLLNTPISTSSLALRLEEEAKERERKAKEEAEKIAHDLHRKQLKQFRKEARRKLSAMLSVWNKQVKQQAWLKLKENFHLHRLHQSMHQAKDSLSSDLVQASLKRKLSEDSEENKTKKTKLDRALSTGFFTISPDQLLYDSLGEGPKEVLHKQLKENFAKNFFYTYYFKSFNLVPSYLLDKLHRLHDDSSLPELSSSYSTLIPGVFRPALDCPFSASIRNSMTDSADYLKNFGEDGQKSYESYFKKTDQNPLANLETLASSLDHPKKVKLFKKFNFSFNESFFPSVLPSSHVNKLNSTASSTCIQFSSYVFILNTVHYFVCDSLQIEARLEENSALQTHLEELQKKNNENVQFIIPFYMSDLSPEEAYKSFIISPETSYILYNKLKTPFQRNLATSILDLISAKCAKFHDITFLFIPWQSSSVDYYQKVYKKLSFATRSDSVVSTSKRHYLSTQFRPYSIFSLKDHSAALLGKKFFFSFLHKSQKLIYKHYTKELQAPANLPLTKPTKVPKLKQNQGVKSVNAFHCLKFLYFHQKDDFIQNPLCHHESYSKVITKLKNPNEVFLYSVDYLLLLFFEHLHTKFSSFYHTHHKNLQKLNCSSEKSNPATDSHIKALLTSLESLEISAFTAELKHYFDRNSSSQAPSATLSAMLRLTESDQLDSYGKLLHYLSYFNFKNEFLIMKKRVQLNDQEVSQRGQLTYEGLNLLQRYSNSSLILQLFSLFSTFFSRKNTLHLSANYNFLQQFPPTYIQHYKALTIDLRLKRYVDQSPEESEGIFMNELCFHFLENFFHYESSAFTKHFQDASFFFSVMSEQEVAFYKAFTQIYASDDPVDRVQALPAPLPLPFLAIEDSSSTTIITPISSTLAPSTKKSLKAAKIVKMKQKINQIKHTEKMNELLALKNQSTLQKINKTQEKISKVQQYHSKIQQESQKNNLLLENLHKALLS